jgi:hypothetical protein
MVEKIILIIIGWLLGLLSEPIKRIFDKASILILFNEQNEKYIRKYDNKDIDFRVEVKNDIKPFYLFNRVTAKKCSVLITLKVNLNDIKNVTNAYIRNRNEFSKIENEYILWDFQYEGKNTYYLDIPPNSGSIATFARYRHINGESYWIIPSENEDKARICLTSNELNFEITVFGENIKPISKRITIKRP